MSLVGRTTLLLAGAIFAASPCAAGDFASFAPLGFSPDGKVFAFEQFGIQDGSGFPYSDIFVIDTETDSFIEGSPFRLRLDNESAGLGQVREQNRQAASAVLEKFDVEDHPGQMVAFNPVSELDTDPHELRYRAFPADPPFGGAYRLALEEFEQEPPTGCENLAETIRGFRLRLTLSDDKTSDQMLHEDNAVPKSRNCPLGYRLGGAMTFEENGAAIHVALVQVISQGFEGHDGRWLAIPFKP